MTIMCSAVGCEHPADPRFAMHGVDGRAVAACDGHGNPGCPRDGVCDCVPARRGPCDLSPWQEVLSQIAREKQDVLDVKGVMES